MTLLLLDGENYGSYTSGRESMRPQWSNTFVTWPEGAFYFRVFGFGLWFGSYEKWPPLFSERYGYERAFRLWPGWRMRVLCPKP